MSYQGGSLLATKTSNHEEDYGTDAIGGVANSAKGEGTTTNELVAKFRFLNVGTCAFVLLFHAVPIILNPVRLTLLLTSPIRLILEVIVTLLALAILMVEGRIPVLGEKALLFMRKIFVGKAGLDLDTAKGRVIGLTIMAVAIGAINYLAIVSKRGAANGDGDVTGSNVVSTATDEDVINANVNSTDIPKNDNFSGSEASSNSIVRSTFSILVVILRCTITSPTILVIAAVISYTIYTVSTFPEYARSRGYPNIEVNDTGGRSVETNYNIQGRTSDGYQTVPTPSWAQPLNE
mmetsp:Transcript_10171/g.21828  ORF Transcript_10171/g.21828 Transcript_10171/m.21828 type:complete len:292 (-) Transcript_10171:169-1044(-)|eukprot:CAMPEP_0171355552 /NCGR_PEP_ID=MMETSP0878-20121228/45280_1 /TAXON_ID=67004 /ORGANISM="Thalassiosira weissflogii, Strain CCMP1336" /LENGTH=291 /DNA_ID=CAMNT_0011861557 /DNA_START=918 /DNA_END=1793 /DNA_ORIENTATION=-